MVNKLKENDAYELIEKVYISRCRRISDENSSDDQIVEMYRINIEQVQKCESLDDLTETIQTDGDFNDDPEGFTELLIDSLIQIDK